MVLIPLVENFAGISYIEEIPSCVEIRDVCTLLHMLPYQIYKENMFELHKEGILLSNYLKYL